jgi:hypothetical protein
MKKIIVVLSLLILFSGAFAQDVTGFIELMKMDLKTKKMAIITEGMHLSEEEAKIFWPLYKEFDAEMDKLFDSNLANIKLYADNFSIMSDEKAKEIGETALKIDKERIKVEQKYLEKISKELSPIIAVRFLQISRQINFLIRLQINSELPLIEKPKEEKKTM